MSLPEFTVGFIWHSLNETKFTAKNYIIPQGKLLETLEVK